MPTPSRYQIRLKPDALERMDEAAKASGERIRRGSYGQPNRSGLMGGLRNGVPHLMFKQPGYSPDNVTLARMAFLHARRRGITWGEALEELCDLSGGGQGREQVAA